MASEQEILTRLAAVITAEFLPGKEVDAKTDLIEAGMDSLDVINLLFQVEETFGVPVPEEDFQDQDLKVVGKMAAYLAQRAK